MTGDEALEALHASMVDVVVAAGALDAGDLDRTPSASLDVESGWTPRQIVAHILWWHERYINVLSAAIDGRQPPALPGTLDDINVRGVEAYGDRSVEELTRALETKQDVLESLTSVLYELPRLERDAVVIVTRDGGTPVGLDGFVGRVTGHLHGHARDIRGRAASR
ncbi:MAG TPA: DinB family protein [Candidatus Limnocylindrales bacterium]